jgi:hypothetical protein
VLEGRGLAGTTISRRLSTVCGFYRFAHGGDRQANAALWRIANVRMRSDPDTRAYIDSGSQGARASPKRSAVSSATSPAQLYAKLPRQALA